MNQPPRTAGVLKLAAEGFTVDNVVLPARELLARTGAMRGP